MSFGIQQIAFYWVWLSMSSRNLILEDFRCLTLPVLWSLVTPCHLLALLTKAFARQPDRMFSPQE